MIPGALIEMVDTSLSGKIIKILGFGEMSKETAQEVKDVNGGRVIVVENDPNLDLTASLNEFEVKSCEQYFPLSDLVILFKD